MFEILQVLLLPTLYLRHVVIFFSISPLILSMLLRFRSLRKAAVCVFMLQRNLT